MNPVDRIFELFERRGEHACTVDLVSSRAHALQAATLAEDGGATPSLVVAALLHDVGHLLGQGRADIAALGFDARHEEVGHRFLGETFGPEVTEPVRLHVQAKRYLCAVEPAYVARLSAASLRSLELQGGPLRAEEVVRFEEHPFSREAVWLRRLDDSAKVRGMATPSLHEFRCLLDAAVCFER